LFRLWAAALAIALGGALSSCDDSAQQQASPAPTQDTYYGKFGIWNHDLDAYKRLDIPSCAEGRVLDPDFTKPPADPDKLRRIAHLFGDCHQQIATYHYGVGVLRVNDLMLGSTCIALRAVDLDPDLPDACNIESALPKPNI
jgi:hypothetical protein